MKIIREIEKTDVPDIKRTLEKVFGSSDYISLERLGGNTNHSYRVSIDGNHDYLVRLPGEGTETVINRKNEQISTQLACDLDIDVPLLYFGEDGTKVMEYIPNALTMDEEMMRWKENIRDVASIFQKLHSCNVNTGVPFEVFDMAAIYEKFIYENNVSMPSDYSEVKKRVISIKSEIDKSSPVQKVPCHNDPLCENWIRGNERIYLVDWEYAGMNDAMWDIAAVSIEACYEKQHDQYLLECYLGHIPDPIEWKHLIASKIYVDYLWTLWAKMRVPFDGQAMEDWAHERYTRMLRFIQEYQCF